MSTVTTPAVVMRTIEAGGPELTNHRFPSAPAVMAPGPWIDASWNTVTTPAVVIRPTLSPPLVNQRLPSGPLTIPNGS